MKKRKILFISPLDFKEKSIQVIRKTPEAYVKAGWDVHYLVARDNSRYGNYFYESVINPDGVTVYRFNKPLTLLIDKMSYHILRTILSKISSYFTVFIFAWKANKILKKNEFNILYGYEVQGVLAAALLRILKRIRDLKIVSRFMGVFYFNIIYKNNSTIKKILNWDVLLSYILPSDCCIMTNDGTNGDKLFKTIKSRNLKNFYFWPNGVDNFNYKLDNINQLLKKYKGKNEILIISISRLEKIKGVDRCINMVNILVNKLKLLNVKLLIIGDGIQKNSLMQMTEHLNLYRNIFFLGAIKNIFVQDYLKISDIFISMYDSSNVGNPLLEAIRANKIIFTLNNGDTGSWIKHRYNGFIYDINDDLIDNIARDIAEVIRNADLRKKIKRNIKITENEKLWTWDERLRAEINEVEKLLN